jgi:hypothetical protein
MSGLIKDCTSAWAASVITTLESVADLKIPTITVAANDLRRAVTIFENINEGGTPLSVFDLVNAKAVPGYETEPSLRDLVTTDLTSSLAVPTAVRSFLPSANATHEGHLLSGAGDGDFPATIRDQYLNLLSVVGHLGSGGFAEPPNVTYLKRGEQLRLSSEQIRTNTSTVTRGLLRALYLLQMRCGQVAPFRINYALMLLPIAYVLIDDASFEDAKVWNKIEYWFWASLFAGRYRERPNERCTSDLKTLYDWCHDAEAPNPYANLKDRVLDEPGYSDRDAFFPVSPGESPEVHRAVADGIVAYTLATTPRDFFPASWGDVRLKAWEIAAEVEVSIVDHQQGTHDFAMKTELHHVVPLGSVTSIGETAQQLRERKSSIYNSPLNLTPISKRANLQISSRPPLTYLQEIPAEALQGHFVVLDGDEIWDKIKDDVPLGDPPEEDGISAILGKRFETVRAEVRKRLDQLGV